MNTPIIQDYVYTPSRKGAGLPISKIITSETTQGGGSRISQLAVPYGLVVIPDAPQHTISYTSKSESSSVVPDDLFDKLVRNVESFSKKQYSRKSAKPKPPTKKQSKRIRMKRTTTSTTSSK